MSHSDIVSNVAVFNADVAAAERTGKEYVLGETNSGMYLPFSYFFPFIECAFDLTSIV